MKATELRIGNLVLFHKKINTVTAIGEASLGIVPEHSDIEYDAIFPIPLTEEWLLKWGFSYYAEDKEYYFGDFRVEFRTQEIKIYYDEKYLGYIEFLHQLQNLFFALTGEELTLK